MGLTFTDIQNLSREATAMYPSRELPVFTEPSDEEKKIAQLQLGFAARLRKSQYYIVEKTKTTELERYSDKYRPSVASQPTLKRSELHEAFFPSEVFEDYFNPKKKKKKSVKTQAKAGKAKLNLDELEEDGEEQVLVNRLSRFRNFLSISPGKIIRGAIQCRL
ncbi:DNA-directed RNA polymerase III, subunit Rpc31 [Gymnopilus junonius]|uniref:DNA-directed RNA polymerase III, subunit Rpc31 n=1 Tax=Gymnopilus junonius TaxID=109634 RepID=A0A9P5TIA9_GYMJU|nr:DNA-directed RNA polymerase III, subunit Rpc31 [Gymnopilus junonius]